MRFFAFSDLSTTTCFFVGETKIIPGRDAKAEGEAIGRPIAITWFQKVDTDSDGMIVQRVNDTRHEMELMLCNLAELIRAAGCYPTASDTATAREVEIELEAKFMDYSLVVFTHTRMADEHFDDPFTFHLSNPSNAEHVHWADLDLPEMTKMGLARKLEVAKGFDRANAWKTLSKSALIVALDPTYVPPPPPPGPGGKAAVKGKGKGGKGAAGRGKGKGKGGKAAVKGKIGKAAGKGRGRGRGLALGGRGARGGGGGGGG